MFPEGLKIYDWMTRWQKEQVRDALSLMLEIEALEEGDFEKDFPFAHAAAEEKLKNLKQSAWGHGPNCGCTYCD